MNYTPKTATFYSNYRIEVSLRDPWFYNHKTPEEKHTSMTRDLDDLRVAANRYLDYQDGVSSHFDREVCCEFCGEPWEDAVDDDGVPWCCAEAQSDYEAQTGRTIQQGTLMQLFIEHEETLAREKWKADALDLIIQLAKTGREFTSDDLYAAGLGPAPHPNMVGPVFYRALNLGYIIPTHRVRRSERKARRHGWVAEYIGAAHMTTSTN